MLQVLPPASSFSPHGTLPVGAGAPPCLECGVGGLIEPPEGWGVLFTRALTTALIFYALNETLGKVLR